MLEFSQHQDFAVFSVRRAPSGLTPLQPGNRPPLGSTVYAVGYALGQGVVIRQGTYTSNTPEQYAGKWDWLRFSAPASPGNSGGPLIDADGKVIGVVLRVSPAENLNYALPVRQLETAR